MEFIRGANLVSRYSGFTLLEFVLVLIIFAALLGAATSYYIQLYSAMQIESVKTQANNFRAAVTTLRSQWLINRLKIHSRPYIWNEKTVYLTEQGWLANSNALMSAAATDQTAYECWQLWQVIFEHTQKVTFDEIAPQESGDWHTSSLSGKGCRFQLSNTGNSRNYFEYYLSDGRVVVQNIE